MSNIPGTGCAKYIIVNYGDGETMMMNPDCRTVLFMEYLMNKCQYDKHALIDLIDEDGQLAYLYKEEPENNLKEVFDSRCNYIPVLIEHHVEQKKGGDDRLLKKVKPQLTDWEKKFPQLEKKIKILTGEVKAKKSGKNSQGLDVPRKGLERKKSMKEAGRLDRSSSTVRSPVPGRSSIMKVSGNTGGKSSTATVSKGEKSSSKGEKPTKRGKGKGKKK